MSDKKTLTMRDDRMATKIIERRENGTLRVASKPVGETLTEQQFKKQVDVNNIIAKFKKTGSITHLRNQASGVYMDLAAQPDYEESLNKVIKAEKAFSEIPAQVRKRFGNDPQQMLSFLANPANQEEAIKLGLRTRPPQQKGPSPTNTPENTVPPQK